LKAKAYKKKLNKAKDMLRNGNKDGALALIENLLKENIGDSGALVLKAEILKNNEGLKIVDDLLKIADKEADDHSAIRINYLTNLMRVKGNILSELGKREEALKIWFRAHTIIKSKSLENLRIIKKESPLYARNLKIIRESEVKMASINRSLKKKEVEGDLQTSGEETIIRTVYVGQKKYIPFEVGVQGLRTVYDTLYEILKGEGDMNNISVLVPFYAKLTHPGMSDMFIYEILNFLESNGRLRGNYDWEEERASKAWKQLDQDSSNQYEMFQGINFKIWEKLGDKSYDKKDFVELMIQIEEDFLSSNPIHFYKRNYKKVITGIDKYYTLLPTHYLKKRYGLGFDTEICTFFPTQEHVKISDLPLNLQEKIDNLQLQTIDGEEYLEGCYVFTFELHDSNEYTLRLSRVNDKFNIKELIINETSIVGFPCKIPSVFGVSSDYSIRPILLTDTNSKRLISRIEVIDGKIVDRGSDWWNREEVQKDIYLTTKDGLNCGIKAVNVLVKRYGNIFQFVRINSEYVSLELMGQIIR